MTEERTTERILDDIMDLVQGIRLNTLPTTPAWAPMEEAKKAIDEEDIKSAQRSIRSGLSEMGELRNWQTDYHARAKGLSFYQHLLISLDDLEMFAVAIQTNAKKDSDAYRMASKSLGAVDREEYGRARYHMLGACKSLSKPESWLPV